MPNPLERYPSTPRTIGPRPPEPVTDAALAAALEAVDDAQDALDLAENELARLEGRARAQRCIAALHAESMALASEAGK